MAQFLAGQMKLPVALIDCPWNQSDVQHERIKPFPRLANHGQSNERARAFGAEVEMQIKVAVLCLLLAARFVRGRPRRRSGLAIGAGRGR